MSTKFTVFDKETAKEIKKILKNRKANFQVKKKHDDIIKKKSNNELDKVRKRKKMTKEEKEAKKKKRTPEEQQKINERMEKLRMLRKKRMEQKK